MSLKVNENQGNTLLIGQLCEGLPDHHGRVVIDRGCGRFPVVVVVFGWARDGNRALSLAPAQPVDTGVHDDAVQPGGYGRVAPEPRSRAVSRKHCLLQGIGGVFPVACGADRDRPQPVPVPPEQLRERLRIACGVSHEEIVVGAGRLSGHWTSTEIS
jgi:hypothetical protein